MKKITLILSLFYSLITFSQLPNDCVNSVITCDNNNVNLDVSGVGLQELGGTNTCSSQENNSLWLLVTPVTSGTLGFILTPESNAITEDYDFFVYGPNVTCSALGFAIRCSTTNPQGAGQANNFTGMNATETDTSEGPGPDGNSFVSWLNVNAGDTYYIIIDRPIGDSAFNLEWTGTATFPDAPANNLPVGNDLSLENCDYDGDGLAVFDLTQDEALVVGIQDVTPEYFSSLNDAQLDVNEITDPTNFASNTAIAYIRLTDNVSNCFSVFEISLTVLGEIVLNQGPKIYECDPSSVAIFDLTTQDDFFINNQTDVILSYHLSEPDADNGAPGIPTMHTNTSNPQTIWVRLENAGTGCFSVSSFEIEVSLGTFENPEPNFVDQNAIYCEDDYPDTTTLSVNLENNNIEDFTFLWSTGATTPSIEVNLSANYTVEVFNDAFCSSIITFTVNGSSVFNSTEPNFIDEEVYYCIDTYPVSKPISAGIENNDDLTFDYEWHFNSSLYEGNVNAPNININEIGVYEVFVSNIDGCVISKIITVLPSEKAVVTNVQIVDTKHRSLVDVMVEINLPNNDDYEYGIDLLNPEDEDAIYQDSTIFENITYGFHTFYVRDKNGCGITIYEVFLLSYPKFLTPNNDGKYDTWNIDDVNAYNNNLAINTSNFNTITNVTIFNRYGKIMAVINPKGNGWDGNYKGKPAPQSSYWFSANLINFKGEKLTKEGVFSLER